jgi:hypothetical protein
MKITGSIALTSLLLLWPSVTHACHEDILQAVGQNVYLMSKPSKNSRVILKLPANEGDLKGCVTGRIGRKNYKLDRQGNRWYYVGFNETNDRRINEWVMAKKTKVTLSCCQAG